MSELDTLKAHYIASMIAVGIATERVERELMIAALIAAGKYIEALDAALREAQP